MTDQLDNDTVSEIEEAPEASRRAFMSKGVIAAAVGAAAGLALSDSASAANGDAILIGGAVQNGTTRTALNGGTSFEVFGGGNGSSSDASIYGQTGGTFGDYGVRGRYDGSTSNDDGAGVYGDSVSGDAAGVRGAHTSATQAGPGVHGSSVGGSGVYGTTIFTFGNAVHGKIEVAGSGVYGESADTSSQGVYGEHKGQGTRAGVGVRGKSDTGTGVVAIGTSQDVLAAGRGRVRLSPESAETLTPTSSGSPGIIARDTAGALWYCYATNKWQKLGGAGTAGAYHPVTPFRVYDSREETDGRFAAGENRTISVADARSVTDYSIATANAVPEGATAVTGNVVAIAPAGQGFLAINPGGTTAVTASTLNFSAGQNIANGSTFALNATRQIEAIFGPGAGAHMAFDVTGFYL
ncbi:MAG: hypothetical protein AB8G14_14325 [Ilumatobacter sp.]